MSNHLEVYRQRGSLRRYRWRRVAGNNRITEGPQQGFTTKWSAKRSAKRSHPEDGEPRDRT